MAATEENPKNKDPDWTVGLKLSERLGRYYVEDVIRVRATPANKAALAKVAKGARRYKATNAARRANAALATAARRKLGGSPLEETRLILEETTGAEWSAERERPVTPSAL